MGEQLQHGHKQGSELILTPLCLARPWAAVVVDHWNSAAAEAGLVTASDRIPFQGRGNRGRRGGSEASMKTRAHPEPWSRSGGHRAVAIEKGARKERPQIGSRTVGLRSPGRDPCLILSSRKGGRESWRSSRQQNESKPFTFPQLLNKYGDQRPAHGPNRPHRSGTPAATGAGLTTVGSHQPWAKGPSRTSGCRPLRPGPWVVAAGGAKNGEVVQPLAERRARAEVEPRLGDPRQVDPGRPARRARAYVRLARACGCESPANATGRIQGSRRRCLASTRRF